jgi:hypothetical protein
MSEHKVTITEDAMFNVVGGILSEMVKSAEAEAELISGDGLSEDAKKTLMKSNSLLTFATISVFGILESRNTVAGKILLDTWNYPVVRDLTEIAFKEEIDAAYASVDDMISKLETEANKETNDPSSEPSS